MRAQLLALRHQLAAMATVVEGLILSLDQMAAGCQHKNKMDLTTFGDDQEKWQCIDCGYMEGIKNGDDYTD